MCYKMYEVLIVAQPHYLTPPSLMQVASGKQKAADAVKDFVSRVESKNGHVSYEDFEDIYRVSSSSEL